MMLTFAMLTFKHQPQSIHGCSGFSQQKARALESDPDLDEFPHHSISVSLSAKSGTLVSEGKDQSDGGGLLGRPRWGAPRYTLHSLLSPGSPRFLVLVCDPREDTTSSVSSYLLKLERYSSVCGKEQP